MPSKTKLIFKLGEESFPTVLSKQTQAESPFGEVINQAESRIEAIANQLLDINNKCEQDNSWQESTPTNIIAFLGDRGSGKTSCMRTLIHDCKERHSDWVYADEIDPSFFDKDHNVLEILIGNLYGAFKELTEDWERKTLDRQNELRGVQDSFKKIKATLKYLKKGNEKDDEYEIDSLNHLNSGGKIKILMKRLVDGLLKLKKKKLLVVCIDDLDLNTEMSYEMMEHIRKYLNIPNLIIIVAAKFGQLFDSICLNLTSIYKDIPNRVSSKDISEMAEKYLYKLIPLDQRLNMPTTDSYMDAAVIIENAEGKRVFEADSLLLGLPSIIFKKTRFLFYNSSGMPSLVIPRSLRTLSMLFSMIVKMEPYSPATEATNKRIFKDYFFSEWLGAIDPDYRQFAKDLLEEGNLAKINHSVVRNLYEFFLSKTDSYEKLRSETERAEKEKTENTFIRQRQMLRNILNPSNSYWNVSLGDVVTVINAVKRSHDSPGALTLLFFIETFYSMKLYETYDLLTEMTDKSGLQLPVDSSTSAPELKTSVRGDLPEYFRLTGGAFFSPTGDSFISTGRIQSRIELRERGLINGKILMDEIRKIEKEYETLEKSGIDLKTDQEHAGLSARLRLCEFFMLTVKNRIDLKSSDRNIRLLNEPEYFKEFGTSTKNMVFDATMPFFNAIYPERAYGRFSKNIYRWAKEDPESLLNKMIGLKPRGKDNDTWELMSKAAIRNMEILEDITEWLHDRKASGYATGAGLIEALISFYSQFDFKESKDSIPVGKYGVKTYGKTSEKGKGQKSFYYIDYAVYAELGKVLTELLPPEDYNKWPASAKLLRNLFWDIMNHNALLPQKDSYTHSEIINALTPYCGLSILELHFKKDSEETIPATVVAKKLADIRMTDRYDFNDKLPSGLQFYYQINVQDSYDKVKAALTEKISQLEEQMTGLKDDMTRITEDLKQETKESSQNMTEANKLQKNAFKLEAKKNENETNLLFLTSREKSETDPAELKKIKTELMKAAKSLNASTAEYNATLHQIDFLMSQGKKASDSAIRHRDQVKSISKKVKETEKEIKRASTELDELNFIMNNPISLD